MANPLPPPAQDCCVPVCDDEVIVQVPGPAGANGADGADGADGDNAYGALAAGFTIPAELANVTITVDNSDWMTAGQIIFIKFAGHFEVVSKADSTHAIIKNLEDTANGTYPGNAPPTTAIPNLAFISPAGLQGPTGQDGTSGAPTNATYITQTLHVDLTNEQPLNGLLASGDAYVKVTQASGVLGKQAFPIPVAEGGTGGITAAAARVALAAAPAAAKYITQTADGELSAEQALSALATGYMKVTTATGVVTSQAVPIPITDGGTGGITAAAARIALGKILPRKGLLASLSAIAMDATADFAMGIAATRFRVTEVIVEGATGTLATGPCTGGLFKTAGGLNPIAADQTLAACVLSTNFASLTLGGIGLTDVFIADLIFRVGTPSTAGLKANVWVFGEDLS